MLTGFKGTKIKELTKVEAVAHDGSTVLHLLLFITRNYTIIYVNLKVIKTKIHSFYGIYPFTLLSLSCRIFAKKV